MPANWFVFTLLVVFICLFIVCIIMCYRYYMHEKTYHDIFMAIHNYNCDRIQDGEMTAIIDYDVLCSYPDLFQSRNAYKRFMVFHNLERIQPYLPQKIYRRLTR